MDSQIDNTITKYLNNWKNIKSNIKTPRIEGIKQ